MRPVFDDFDAVLPVSNPPGREWWVVDETGAPSGQVIGWAVSFGGSTKGEPTVALPIMVHEDMIGAMAVEARVRLAATANGHTGERAP
jgi:hypothetical protein